MEGNAYSLFITLGVDLFTPVHEVESASFNVVGMIHAMMSISVVGYNDDTMHTYEWELYTCDLREHWLQPVESKISTPSIRFHARN